MANIENHEKLLSKFKLRLKNPGDLDDEFKTKYFSLLVGQYKTMAADDSQEKTTEGNGAHAEAEEIIKKYDQGAEKTTKNAPSWEEIYRLELAILKLEPFETLCRKLSILRQEYGEVANADERVKYAESNPKKIEPDKQADTQYVKQLRADAVNLQQELNWIYTVLWIQEGYRSKLSSKIVLITVFVALIFALAAEYGCTWGLTSQFLLPEVILAGLLGGCVSTLQRIQAMKLDGNADLNLLQIEHGNWSIYCSPLLGGIFAVVLCGIFAAGLTSDAIFPKFDHSKDSLFCFLSLDCASVAKLLIWSFIAGFSERLVPDKLDKLASSVEEGKK